MSSCKGHNGSLHVEDDAVVFTREGLAARAAFGKNAPPERIPLQEITGVVHKPAGRLTNGQLQVLRNGRHQPDVPIAKDPHGLLYLPKQEAEIARLVGWLRTVAERNADAATTAIAAPIPVPRKRAAKKTGASAAAAPLLAAMNTPAPDAASEAATTVPASSSTRVEPTVAPGETAQPAWWQKRGAQLAAAGLFGLLLGSCSGGEDNADELERLRADRASATEELEDAEQRADRAAASRDELQDRVSVLEEQNDGLTAQVAAAASAAQAAAPEPEPEPEPEPAPVEEKPVVEPEPEPEPAQASYANCAEARAAGAAPIQRGEPGYSSKLDRDGDGTACDT